MKGQSTKFMVYFEQYASHERSEKFRLTPAPKEYNRSETDTRAV
jgi:hypothetical protein